MVVQRQEPVVMELEFENAFVPALIGLGRDRRALSIHLNGISISETSDFAREGDTGVVLRF